MKPAAGHHRQIAATLAWEFWACGWAWIVSAPLLAMSLPCLIFVAITWPERSFRVGELGDSFQFPLYWTSLIMLGPSVISALGKPQHRYTLPASNSLIVSTLMACAMATLFVQYAVIALSLNALFDLDWPVLGPSLLAAVLVAWCHAMLWSTSNSTGLQVLASAVDRPTVGDCNRGVGTARQVDPGFSFQRGPLAIFAIRRGCGHLCRRGHVRLRQGSRGRRVRLRPIDRLASPRLHSAKQIATRSFFLASAGSTLAGMDPARPGPAGWNCGVGLVLLIIALIVPAKEGPDFASAFSAFFLAPLSVIGLFFGSRSALGEFGNFNGSRPLSDSKLSGAILKSFTLSLISSAVVWLAFFVLVNVIVVDRRVTSDITHAVRTTGVPALTARIVLCALAVWSGVGLVTALTLAGRRVVGLALRAFFGVWMAGVLVTICLRPGIQDAFMQAYTAAWLSVCLIAAAATFIVSCADD